MRMGGARRGWRGNQIQALPESQQLVFEDFSGGYDARNRRSPNSTSFALDTLVTDEGRIRRVPGVVTAEQLSEREPTQVALQPSLDYTTELLLFDPPWLGVKYEGDVEWTNAGLPSSTRPFAWTNFADRLIFGNGTGSVYSREPFGAPVALTEAPQANAYASFAGRVLALGATINGNYEPLGVAWSAANSLPDDWTSEGSGYEFLIDDMSAGDEGVALVTLGLDLVAVMLRNSLWIGRPTRQVGRPVAFTSRVPRLGPINAAVCASTRLGVVFLAASGVWLFDGNGATLLSEQINPQLLPLDTEQYGRYSAFYDPLSHQYYLFTPNETWVYDLLHQRWHRRSLVAYGAVLWSTQYDATTWAEVVGSWAVQTLTWRDFKPRQSEGFRPWFLGNAEGERALGYEDEAQSCHFDTGQTPWWELPFVQGQRLTQPFTVQQLELEYVGGGSIGLQFPTLGAGWTGGPSYSLPDRTELTSVPLWAYRTGLGTGMRLDFGTGFVEVSRATIRGQLGGQLLSGAATRLGDTNG